MLTYKFKSIAGCWWLTPVILDYSRGRSGGSRFAVNPGANSSARPYLKTSLHKKRLVEWLKVKALSSSPSNV
jgi:hypothetical protein